MPSELQRPDVATPGHIDHWAGRIGTALAAQSVAVAAISTRYLGGSSPAGHFVHYLCAAVQKVLANCAIDHLYVEGGATASVLVRLMDWTLLPVVDQLAAGVVTMKTPRADAYLTIKPGSYPWPDSILGEGLPRSAPTD
jgi:uncharacterized protein YgbK (DUF1537 family)